MDTHNASLEEICGTVRRFHEQNEPYRVYHGTSYSTRASSYQKDAVVDISKLGNIIAVDQEKMVALVEPNVSMEQLVDATLPYGLVAPIVMEYPGITVGGGFAGAAGESSSFKYGPFEHIVNWIEVVLPSGEKVAASMDERPDLFIGCAGSMGTLGVVTLLEVQLVKAEPFVELTCELVSSISDAVEAIKQSCEDPNIDYVDGIMFTSARGIVMTGKRTSKVPDDATRHTYSGARDPWFYLHAKELSQNQKETTTIFMPLREYLFRYDRGAFWSGELAFKYFFVPFNRITRFLLNRFLDTRTICHAMHRSGIVDQYIVDDMAVPIDRAAEFTKYVDQTVGIYPLWLCPIVRDEATRPMPILFSAPSSQKGKKSLLLDIGIWGKPPRYEQIMDINIALERKSVELGGTKALYAPTYLSEEEFWKAYDYERYQFLREKYGATKLPSVYDKAKFKQKPLRFQDGSILQRAYTAFWGVRPFAGVWGAVSALIGGEHLFVRH